MPTPKFFVRQYKSADDKTYMVYRYWDDHNKNYEYQVYELVIAKEVARKLGAADLNENNVEQNSRRMCDWVWDNISPIDEE